MSIELREPMLVQEIEQLAFQMVQPAETVLEMAVRAYLEAVEQQAIHAETEAFWAQHDDLVASYAGQHVALYRGQVVDHDVNVACLEKRTRARFGPLPVLIALVEPGPCRDLHWRGGRLEERVGVS
jgi:hypothetical protein